MDIYKSKMKLFNDTYVMYWLLEFMDENSIICLCKASKKLNKICKQYIELEDDKRFEVTITESHWSSSEIFKEYCSYNDVIKIRKILKMNIKLWWKHGLYGACYGGHIATVQLMIEKGANDWNYGLHGACKGGHLDIVKLMIEKGAYYWNSGFYEACYSGHIATVQLMIEKGANEWNGGLEYACYNDHIDIVKLMIAKGAYECWSCNESIEDHLSKSE